MSVTREEIGNTFSAVVLSLLDIVSRISVGQTYFSINCTRVLGVGFMVFLKIRYLNEHCGKCRENSLRLMNK